MKAGSALLVTTLLLACAGAPPGDRPLVLVTDVRWAGQPGSALLVTEHGFSIGPEDEVRAVAGAGVRALDASGGELLLGFGDAHAHLLPGGLSERRVKLHGLPTLEACLDAVRRWAAEHPEAPWIQGGGWSYDIVPKGELPSRQALDRVVPDRPVILESYDGHSAWVNSRALALARIGPDTSDPPTGKIVREKDGKTPQGTLLEHAASRVHAVVPEPDPVTQREALALALRQSLRLGITTVHTLCESAEEVAHYEALLAAGRLPVDVVVALPLETPLEEVLAVRERLRRPELRFGFLKGFLDGVIESRTAYLLEPYAGTEERGRPNYEPDELLALVSRANAAGVPVALHAIGDAAVRMALDTYEAAARSRRGRVRNRIEHLEVVHPDDYPRFAALDVVASMQPYHAVPLDAPSPDDVWSANLGPARLARSFPWRALLDAEAPLAFGSDWNVFTQDPLKGLAAAVTRQNERGLPAGGAQPQQRLSLEQALRAYTEGVAYAEGPAPGPEPTHSFVVVEGLDPSDPRTFWTAQVRAVVHRGRLTTFD